MLTIRIIPKMRLNPPASRNKSAPYETPLKSPVIQNSIGLRAHSEGRRRTNRGRDYEMGSVDGPGAHVQVGRGSARLATAGMRRSQGSATLLRRPRTVKVRRLTG